MIIIKCSECGHEAIASSEIAAEIDMNMHKCSVDLSKLSDADLLARIRKEQGKVGSAFYSDWVKRGSYWYLDYLDIVKTQLMPKPAKPVFSLWSKKENRELRTFKSLKAAKNHGLKLINQKRG